MVDIPNVRLEFRVVGTDPDDGRRWIDPARFADLLDAQWHASRLATAQGDVVVERRVVTWTEWEEARDG